MRECQAKRFGWRTSSEHSLSTSTGSPLSPRSPVCTPLIAMAERPGLSAINKPAAPVASGGLWRVFLAATAASLCNIAFGYDVGVVSGLLSDMAQSLDLSRFEQEAATSGLNFVAGFGAILMSGNFLDLLGRRWTIFIASVSLIMGAALVATSHEFYQLLAGRALQGLGSGASWCACSVYITEIAPDKYRGSLVSLADISINLGILIGYGVDFAVSSAFIDNPDRHWRISMGLAAVLPLLFCLVSPCLPETPRWLVSKGRDAEALHVLRRYALADAGPGQQPEEILADIQAAARADAARSGGKGPSWRASLWPAQRAERKAVAVALLLGPMQQITGTEAILYYAPTVLSSLSRYNRFYASMSIGASKFLGELVAANFVDTAGRRVMMTANNLLVCLAVFGIALSFLLHTSVLVTVICLCLVMLTFSLGPGPFTFVVVNEMVPLSRRAHVVAASVFFNRLTSGTVALTFLTLKNGIGVSTTFFLYGGLGLLATFFYFVMIPNTTGMSLEQASGSGGGGHGGGHGGEREGDVEPLLAS